LDVATRSYRRIAGDHRKPLARYGAIKSALRERLAPAELHHQWGHDPAGPSEVTKSAKELRPRVAGYRLNGKVATVELPDVATPTSMGMNAAAPGYVLAQLATDANSRIIPYQLNFIEMRLSADGTRNPRRRG
jgi:hypothetical protein